MKIIQHFVGGKSFSGNSKRLGNVFNPATGEKSAQVKLASTQDVDEAVASAKKLSCHGLTNLHFKEREFYLSTKN